MRGRTFGLVQSLMRIDLLLVTGATPFLAGRSAGTSSTCRAARSTRSTASP